ncbi:MAG TPA: hypothetical protein VFU19_18695 [Iamia sp.]|nr:hypothetical protein [Iamia sp.]
MLLTVMAITFAACGSGDEPLTSGQDRPAPANERFDVPDVGVPVSWGADLGAVFDGRLPVIAATADAVVALSAADPSIGLDSSIVAVSADRQPFRPIELGTTLVAVSAVVDDDGTAVIVGNECRSVPDPEGGCDPGALVPRAFEVDVAAATSTELPAPPEDHVGARGLGVTSRGFAFQVATTNGGEVTATWTGSDWTSTALPFASASVCAADDQLVAVAPTGSTAPAGGQKPSGGNVPEGAAPVPADPDSVMSGERTPAGEPFWKAAVSDDAGETWSEPVEHRSIVDDIGFEPFTVCGPDHTLVHTMQLAWFTPRTGAWVGVEGSLATGPGAAIAYRPDGSSVLWSAPAPSNEPDPEAEPAEPSSQQRISFGPISGSTPKENTETADLPDGLTLMTANGAGAARHGYLIVSQAGSPGYDLIQLS